MAQRLGNYLRVRRRQAALTQKELAFLLGYGSETIVSRFERHERKITLTAAFACELVFGAGPRELFPVLLEQVEDGVVRRMYELYERLKKAKPTPKTAAKLQVLHDALSRVTGGAAPRQI